MKKKFGNFEKKERIPSYLEDSDSTFASAHSDRITINLLKRENKKHKVKSEIPMEKVHPKQSREFLHAKIPLLQIPTPQIIIPGFN
jgi:hypothetical protein